MLGPWITTYTGKRFHLFASNPSEVCIEDIAHALSNKCRWAGHSKKFYSVAEHSLIVSRRLAEINEPEVVQMAGLLHDAAEAYTGDVGRPLKKEIVVKYFLEEPFSEFEERLLRRIYRGFGLIYRDSPVIKEVDDELLATEAVYVLKNGGGPDPETLPDSWDLNPVRFLSPSEAEEAFLERYTTLRARM